MGKERSPRPVSFSALDSFRTCPHQWFLTYVERWTPPEDSPALERGTLFHSVMAAHYNHLRTTQKPTVRSARSAVLPLLYDGNDQSEIQMLVEWIYEGYVEHWGLDDGWRILAIEQRLNHPLPKIRGVKLAPRKATGVIDLVVEERADKSLWLVDHKSHKDLPSERKIELEDQMPFYDWFLQALGKPVLGVIYNTARALKYKTDRPQPLEERFSRIPLHFNDKQLATVAREAALTVTRMDAIKTRAQAERNTGEHCLFRCSLTESCLAARKGMDENEFMRAKGFVRRRD